MISVRVLLPVLLVAASIAMSLPLRAAAEPAADTPSWTVAVVVEPGMLAYGGTPACPPAKMAAMFQKYGIPAKAVTVADLAAPGALTPTAFPVVVLPYGNAYPQPLYEALRAYHAQGGCLMTNGIPFTHACEKEGGKWVDKVGPGRGTHDAAGIGVGGYAGPGKGVLQLQDYGFQKNPLGLRNPAVLPPGAHTLQWLDSTGMDPKDEVIPLVGLVVEGQKEAKPVSAILRHNCSLFPGALDIWVGTPANQVRAEDAFFAEQLFVRGAAWCLAQKKLWTDDKMKSLFAACDAAATPQPFPKDLAYAPTPRPWGDTFLPKSKTPAKKLFVVDAAALPDDVRTALACLQGLTSREEPSLWLRMSERDDFCMDVHRKKGYFEPGESTADWMSAFTRYRKAIKGVIITDPKLYRSELLAANIAACEDLIVASPQLAPQLVRTLAVPVFMDLRGKFKTYAEGMQWVWDHYKDKLSHHLCYYVHPGWLKTGAFAYGLQWKAVLFWIAGPVDASEPGADLFQETGLMARILSEMEPNIPVLGFPFGGEGVGPGEPEGVRFASRFAKALVCNDSLSNSCVMSGVRLDGLKQQHAAPPALERDKIYIAMNVSDGDNQNCWVAFFKSYFENPAFGTFPLAFGMGPPIMDLMPGVAQWYVDRAGTTTEFMADVSGIGYINPEEYGAAYKDRDAVYRGFLDWTAKYCAKLDMGTLRTVGGEDPYVARYAKGLPQMDSILADMGRYSGREGIKNLTYTLEGKPVFRAVTSWRYGKEGFLREVREQVGNTRPAFVNGFVHCWTFNSLDAVNQEIVKKRDPDMVFVTPSQLAALYKEAKQKGWTE